MKNTLKDLRKEHGYSQDGLAEILGVSRQTVISIEKGKYNPSLPLALIISQIFNTTVERVFFLEEDDLKNKWGDRNGLSEDLPLFWLYFIIFGGFHTTIYTIAEETFPTMGYTYIALIIMCFCLSYLAPQFQRMMNGRNSSGIKQCFILFSQ